MKVDIPKRSDAPQADVAPGHRLPRLVGAIVGGFAVLMLIAVAYSTFAPKLLDQRHSLSERWSIALGEFRRGAGDENPLPELVFDVPFKEMRKIYLKREQALAVGNLVQGADDFVRGDVRFRGETIPVRLRLKGDFTDHLVGRKWSFRVRTRDNAEIMGMRRFSIQAPGTRDYQAEPMFFAVMRSFGVLAPRYQFVSVVINGESLGIMALEEFFSKELLESSRRREGVILRFDESMVWDARDSLSGYAVGINGAFDNFTNSRIDSIASSRVAADPVLSKQYAAASAMLMGFSRDELDASQVFDVDLLGRYLAVTDMLGAAHAVAWNNMRFYFNPISARLEPIAFDANLHDMMRGEYSLIDREQIVIRMLEDERVWRVYLDTLRELAAMIDDGRLESLLRDEENRHLANLQTEFRKLQPFDTRYLDARSDQLLARMTGSTELLENSLKLEHEAWLYPALAHVDIDADRTRLSIESAVPYDVEVFAATWVNDLSAERRAAELSGLPLALPPRALYGRGVEHQLPLESVPDGDGWHLEVSTRIAGRSWHRDTRAVTGVDPRRASPVPSASVEDMVAAHSFVSVDEASKRVRVPAGDWTLESSLVLPEGYGLDLEAGVTLRFPAEAILLVHGDVQWRGTDESPIRLLPIEGGRWPGLVIMRASTTSHIEHVVIRDTSSVILPSWTLTGGINFYKSDVDIRNSEFSDSHGEDALNIIESQFTIQDTTIRNTASDAFDSDFSDGSVTGGRFVNIGYAGGGDAIDISGSTVKVDGVLFETVYDKALSVGERSTMNAYNVTINGTGTGAAAKDGSALELNGADIVSASFAGMTAYIKKPEFGPAQIVATNVTVRDAETVTLVQNGSRVSVDGSEAETTDVDVDALYETVMRKGLK